MKTIAPPPSPAEIRDQSFHRMFGRVTRMRMFAVPLQASLALGVAIVDPTPWRRYLLVGAAIVAAPMAWEDLRRLRAGLHRGWPMHILLAALLFHGVLLFSTGGLDSPLLPGLVVASAVVGISVGTRPSMVFLTSVLFGLIALFAFGALSGVLPDLNLGVFGGKRAEHSALHSIVSAGLLAVMVAGMASFTRFLRGLFDESVNQALSARASYIEAHVDQTKTLQALAGQIAHELKNPLASVKGLSALLARDVADGRHGERLSVLRREVDRMQEILEEFLNFSRPLLPLAQRDVELVALCCEVMDLHEGIAAERRVRLELGGARELQVRCDPKKTKQILINLVQNALHASPAGGMLRINVEVAGKTAAVRVVDEGPGLSADVAERLFQPGVTSKSEGSGLGLAIARGIARQHGGDLTLRNGDDLGCVAELTLPFADEHASPAVL